MIRFNYSQKKYKTLIFFEKFSNLLINLVIFEKSFLCYDLYTNILIHRLQIIERIIKLSRIIKFEKNRTWRSINLK